ncbi:hypothetical protein AVEN_234801-1 [Araneus ventricosus]|uniref:Tc1-like transposase DDE domain-containing protein n=1 Tax=Araneus ventricosus TaxID=182803 RepID=A0A4Y2F9Y5_ARAVE|nr:hypothetical protein AVEN_234801-1 [Araneus ventricosus]
MWLQHDGAPQHYSKYVRQHLNITFGKHWICRDDPAHWPARSPDQSCLDFPCWGQMETLVYETTIHSVKDVVARISAAAEEMRDMLRISHDVRNSMRRRCEVCVTASS